MSSTPFVLEDAPSNVDLVWAFHTSSKAPAYHGHARFTDLIFDLEDLFFTDPTSPPQSLILPRIFRHICRSSIWFDYQKGHLTEDEAYRKVAKEYDLPLNNVADAFRAARDSVKINTTLFDLIGEIKLSGRRVFAMSNISAPDCDALAKKVDPFQWALFDQVFTSAMVHERKPNLGFFKRVFEEEGLDPLRTIFVDSKIENVLTARSFGMQGIVFDDPANAVRQLRNFCGDPLQRARSFLSANKKLLCSVTSRGLVMHENFSQLLIWETTGDRSLVEYNEFPRLVNFFRGPSPKALMADIFWQEDFPDDLDDTSIALTVSPHVDTVTKHSIMDEMLSFRNQDGLITVYFDHTRPRIDPVVCVNVLTFFYRNNRGHELDSSLEWVYLCLVHRAYTDGTLYYVTAEAFLFFLTRLMQSSLHVRRRFEPIFKERIQERFGVEGDSLALAMRILAAASVGLVNRLDLDKLLSMQQDNGSWTKSWYYKFPSSGILIGNDGLATAMAMKAIETATRLVQQGSSSGMDAISEISPRL